MDDAHGVKACVHAIRELPSNALKTIDVRLHKSLQSREIGRIEGKACVWIGEVLGAFDATVEFERVESMGTSVAIDYHECESVSSRRSDATFEKSLNACCRSMRIHSFVISPLHLRP